MKKKKLPGQTASPTVLAVAAGLHGTGPFRAVCLRRDQEGLELLWSRTLTDPQRTLADCVAELKREPGAEGARLVVAMDASGVALYPLELPPVKESQLPPLVRMQAESLLPLPAEQMHLTYGALPGENGAVPCLLAAVRRDTCRGLFDQARRAGARRIIPDGQALAQAWSLAAAETGPAVLLHLHENNSRLLLIREGRLVQAATLDVGRAELADAEGMHDQLGLFAHDLLGSLQRFGVNPAETPIRILCPEEGCYGTLAERLRQFGLTVQPQVLRADSLAGLRVTEQWKLNVGLGRHQQDAGLFDALEPLGAAALAIEDEPAVLDFLHDPSATERAPAVDWKLWLSLTAAVVMLAAMLVVWKHVDQSRLEALSTEEFATLIKEQSIRKAASQERPDILDLLTKLKEATPEGMLIDSFQFQKGKPVAISSAAGSFEQLAEFQKRLEGLDGISDVAPLSPTFDEKTKKVSFRMTFHYKNYTRK